jgi:hypothetical protein
VEARELHLYIINDGELYRGRAQAIIKNLRKKFLKGDYDQEKAYKAWSYLAEDGAKKYHKEFGSNGTWSAMFPKAVRDEVAKELEDSYKEEVEETEMVDKKEKEEVNEKDSAINEDVVGMVANGSIQMLLGLPEFQDFKDDNLFWSMSTERVPVFGYVKNDVKTITTIEIPLFRNQSELIKFPKESRVGLAKQLKMAIV